MARPQKYIVSLTDKEREQLTSISKNYRYSERKRNHAQILLQAEQDNTDRSIATAVGCHCMTVRSVQLRFSESQLQKTDTIAAKQHVKRAEQENRAPRALDGEKEAHLIALVCSEPPLGASRWTLQLVKDHLIEMQIVANIGKETIRRTLKKTNLSLGKRKAGTFFPPRMPAS